MRSLGGRIRIDADGDRQTDRQEGGRKRKGERVPGQWSKVRANAWVNENLNDAQILELAKHQIMDSKMSAYTVAKNFQQSTNPCEKVEYKIFTPKLYSSALIINLLIIQFPLSRAFLALLHL